MRLFKPVLLCLTLALAACGFEPVYGPNGTGTQLQNRVLVDPPRDREGFLLVQRLEERLGRAGDPAYRLSVELNLRQEDRAIDPDGDIRRFHLIGAATYALMDTSTGTVIRSDRVDNFVGYSATGTTVATLAAQRDAQARLMTILADEIVVQLQASDL
ncbi:LPS assembly lipoprotein LptE [uncultured Tateyamaria sp.]|uniref:LPS assembly lipoprotein LptE n=1 Tax=uncultured Tateyamaria sp. TaxID=455651 RepID=UPI002623849C|nr:LPS assembly lipoprotein LptE [uncultured Tateyamaria sp.]